MAGLIDQFLPEATADIAERHETVASAPADVAYETACGFAMQSVPWIRAIFRLRELLMGSSGGTSAVQQGLVAQTLELGWRKLAERPGRELVMGAVTQPWLADVVFRGVAPQEFAAFQEPELVKIVWTIEAEPLGGDRTVLRTRTRVRATDETARRKFRRYWFFAGFFIVLIRRLLLRELRRSAERAAISPARP